MVCEVTVSYVDDNLLNNESVLQLTHRHWITFLTWRGLLTLFIGPWIDRQTSEFAVTDRRIIIKVGLISRKTMDLNLSKVESIDVEQGFAGRMFGFGTMMVVGTGGSRETFHYIADPTAFRRAVQQASADMQGPAGGARLPAPAAAEDPVARLARAKAMLDQGLIAPEEYQATKDRLLNDL